MDVRSAVWMAALVACGEDSGGVTAQGDCELDIVVSGGYSWKSASVRGAHLGCGSVGPSGTTLGVEAYGPEDGTLRSVNVLFGAPETSIPPLEAGQVGTFDITVDIEVQDTTIVPRAQWRSVMDGCSFKIVKNELTPDDFFDNKYVIGGTVTCAGELRSFNTTPGKDPITVNAFKFQTFENYD